MLKDEIVYIADIYVPLKRRNSLNQETVAALAESILEDGMKVPIQLRKDGQRFTWGYAFGRADHYWEGFKHYTHLGKGAPVFQEFIGGLTAAQRQLWRFPTAGHPYYTEQTLALLTEQYPGWNSDEYRLAMP